MKNGLLESMVHGWIIIMLCLIIWNLYEIKSNEILIRANERLTIQVEQLTEANHRLVEEIGETINWEGE